MSQTPSVTSGIGPPDSDECRNSSDLGRLYHDSERDIWYECEFDRRHGFLPGLSFRRPTLLMTVHRRRPVLPTGSSSLVTR
jgi:hypothetical protein